MMSGKERREEILQRITNSKTPVSGAALAKSCEVSRQVIVQDIALIRAAGYDVIATNRGYICSSPVRETRVFEVNHTDEQMQDELNTIVDFGGVVLDVIVRHEVYGELRAELNISSRNKVALFMEEIRQGNPLERLKEYYSEFDIVKENEELSFSGGLVGNLGYDFVRYAEVLPDNNPDEIGIETIQMMLMTKFILVDHVAETLTAVILGEDSEDGKKKALAEAAELIEEARKNAGQIPDRNFTHDGVIVNQSDTLEQYCEKVEKIKQYIREGHIFQTVLSQRWTIETKQTGFELYKELRELNPSPYLLSLIHI